MIYSESTSPLLDTEFEKILDNYTKEAEDLRVIRKTFVEYSCMEFEPLRSFNGIIDGLDVSVKTKQALFFIKQKMVNDNWDMYQVANYNYNHRRDFKTVVDKYNSSLESNTKSSIDVLHKNDVTNHKSISSNATRATINNNHESNEDMANTATAQFSTSSSYHSPVVIRNEGTDSPFEIRSGSKVKRKLWDVKKTNGTPLRYQKEFYEKDESKLSDAQKKARRRKDKCTGFLACTFSSSKVFLNNMKAQNQSENRRQGKCSLCSRRTPYYCFGCKARLCLTLPNTKEDSDQLLEYLEIPNGEQENIVIAMTCWLRHHEKGIDRHFEKVTTNDG